MKRMKHVVLCLVIAIIVALLPVLGCGAAAPFSMQAIPEHMEAIAGQRCVFLVVVADEGQGNEEGKGVSISATTPGAAVIVNPQAITPGQVAEVTVIPDEASAGSTLTVTVDGERDGLKQTEAVTLVVKEELPGPGPAIYAARFRDRFIPWLAANHPQLGITSETEWTGTIVRPFSFEVTFYLFFSEDWEMGVTWHVTTPEADWTRIYLRHRTTEVHPSYAFEISHWSDEQEEPHAIEPPESVWR